MLPQRLIDHPISAVDEQYPGLATGNPKKARVFKREDLLHKENLGEGEDNRENRRGPNESVSKIPKNPGARHCGRGKRKWR
jgi:hypothetical protein